MIFDAELRRRFRCPLCPSPRKQFGWRTFIEHLRLQHDFEMPKHPEFAHGKGTYYCRICDDGPRTVYLRPEALLFHLWSSGGLAQHILEQGLKRGEL